MEQKTENNGGYRDEKGRFIPGNPGGGRPKITPEERIVREARDRAINGLVKEYKDTLAEALPKISPVLIKMAKRGNLGAIKEVNTILIGKEREVEESNMMSDFPLTTDQVKRIALHILRQENLNQEAHLIPKYELYLGKGSLV